MGRFTSWPALAVVLCTSACSTPSRHVEPPAAMVKDAPSRHVEPPFGLVKDAAGTLWPANMVEKCSIPPSPAVASSCAERGGIIGGGTIESNAATKDWRDEIIVRCERPKMKTVELSMTECFQTEGAIAGQIVYDPYRCDEGCQQHKLNAAIRDLERAASRIYIRSYGRY